MGFHAKVNGSLSAYICNGRVPRSRLQTAELASSPCLGISRGWSGCISGGLVCLRCPPKGKGGSNRLNLWGFSLEGPGRPQSCWLVAESFMGSAEPLCEAAMAGKAQEHGTWGEAALGTCRRQLWGAESLSPSIFIPCSSSCASGY